MLKKSKKYIHTIHQFKKLEAECAQLNERGVKVDKCKYVLPSKSLLSTTYHTTNTTISDSKIFFFRRKGIANIYELLS